jgi:glycyl-tRNA synthetase
MPLMKKPQLEEPAKKIFDSLQKKYKCEYDVAGSIGKRYRRQDEIGTPYCITFDYDSLEDHAVTIRDRDSMSQERVAIDQIETYILNKFGF